MALCDIHVHFVWQAWHLMTWIVTLRGRRGTYGIGLALHNLHAHNLLTHNLLTHNLLTHNSFCVAGVALCDIHVHFVWQAWHLMTWIVTLSGRRGTYGTGLALVSRLVPRRCCDAVAFCVAGVALCDIHLHFVWQAWHLMTWIVTLRGRRGTYGTGLALVAGLVPRRRCDAAAFCVAGVALCTACSHTTYSHTTYIQLVHIQLAHTHNLLTYNLLTHNLLTHTTYSHTQLAHTHTQLAHTQLVLHGRRGTL